MRDSELTRLVCAALGGIDGWVFYLDGDPYPQGSVGVHYGDADDQTERAVSVRVYGGTDPRFLRVRTVQLITRGASRDPAGADELADDALPVMSALHLTPGITYAERTSFGPLEADGNHRELRSDNYRIILDNQEAFRP